MSERLSVDPDARWLKRGGRCLFSCTAGSRFMGLRAVEAERL